MQPMPSIVQRMNDLLESPEFLNIINEGEPSEEHGSGGCLCVLGEEYDNPVLQCMGGKVSREEGLRYYNYALEKAMRLRANNDHICSWQSRDPDNKKWGGAIRTPEGTIYSFSGLPERADHALCIFLAYKDLDPHEIAVLVTTSGSDDFFNNQLLFSPQIRRILGL